MCQVPVILLRKLPRTAFNSVILQKGQVPPQLQLHKPKESIQSCVLCVYMWSCVLRGMCTFVPWVCGPEVDIMCLPLSLFTLVFEAGSLIEPGAHPVG